MMVQVFLRPFLNLLLSVKNTVLPIVLFCGKSSRAPRCQTISKVNTKRGRALRFGERYSHQRPARGHFAALAVHKGADIRSDGLRTFYSSPGVTASLLEFPQCSCLPSLLLTYRVSYKLSSLVRNYQLFHGYMDVKHREHPH